MNFPMVISIETKRSGGGDGDFDKALVQVVLWAMSQFNRYRKIAGPNANFTFPIPMLVAAGAQWSLYFAIDGEQRTKVFQFGPIGRTTTLENSYKLLESLKEIMKFVMDIYVPHFVNEVLRADPSATISTTTS